MDWPVAFAFASTIAGFVGLAFIRERAAESERQNARLLLERQAETSKAALGEVGAMAGSLAANSVGGRPLSLYQAEQDLRREEFLANQRRIDEQNAYNRQMAERMVEERKARFGRRDPEVS